MNERRHIKSFNGLRGLAFLAVTLFHLYPNRFAGGYLGVVIFFMLSGYLLTMHQVLSPEKNPLGKLKERFFTLSRPLVFFVFLMTVLVVLFYRQNLPLLRKEGLGALLGVNNIVQVLSGLSYFEVHGAMRPFTHLWALSVELQFYLFWALCLILLPPKSRKAGISAGHVFLMMILTIASAIAMMVVYHRGGEDPTRTYYGTDTRFFHFTMGAIFGLMGTKGVGKKSQAGKGQNALILLAIVILCFFIFQTGPFAYYGGLFLFSLITGFLLLYISQDNNPVARFFHVRPLQILGKYSFSLYLFQYGVMILAQELFANSTLPYFVQVLIQLIIVALLGFLSYHLTEKRVFEKKAYSIMLLVTLVIYLISFATQKDITAADIEQEIMGENIAIQEQEREEEPKPLLTSEYSPAVLDEVEKVNEEFPQFALNDKDLSRLHEMDGYMLGDSVTLGASENVMRLLPNFDVDGKVSRQLVHGIDILQGYNFSTLEKGAPVVIQLGTNSDFNKSSLDSLIAAVPEDHDIYLINTSLPHAIEESVNQKFMDKSLEDPRVHVIDWHRASKSRQDLFSPDHTHPQRSGQLLFRQVIGRTLLNYEYLKKDMADQFATPLPEYMRENGF